MGATSHKPRIGSLNYNYGVTEQLGKPKANSVKFDDWQFLDKKFNYRLVTVHIWHNKNFITGLQAVYEMDGMRISPGSHLAEPSDKKVTFNLASDEFIVRAYIRSGEWIDAIRLETNKSNFIEVGGSGGSLTLFDVPQGNQFIAFIGETDKYLETIALKYHNIYC